MAALFRLCLGESLSHAKHMGFSMGDLLGLHIPFKGGNCPEWEPCAPDPPDIVLFVNPKAWGRLG